MDSEEQNRLSSMKAEETVSDKQASERLCELEVLSEKSNGHVLDSLLNDEITDTTVVHHHRVITENPGKAGLWNIRAIRFLLLWYFFSGCTLFLNKYILSFMRGDPIVLGKLFSLPLLIFDTFL